MPDALAAIGTFALFVLGGSAIGYLLVGLPLTLLFGA